MLGVLVSASDTPRGRAQLVADSHQLAGNAGSFGCPGVSTAARALLEAARGTAELPELQALHAALRLAVDEATRAG